MAKGEASISEEDCVFVVLNKSPKEPTIRRGINAHDMNNA